MFFDILVIIGSLWKFALPMNLFLIDMKEGVKIGIELGINLYDFG